MGSNGAGAGRCHVQALVATEKLEMLRSKMLKDGVLALFYIPGSAGLVFFH
jgi:hypothetical protein